MSPAAVVLTPFRRAGRLVRRLRRRIGDELVQVMYGVEGERDLTEHTLAHLAGYRDSRPVRVGNQAWEQEQLDVLGEVLDAVRMNPTRPV